MSTSVSEVYRHNKTFDPSTYTESYLSLSDRAEPFAKDLLLFRLQQLHQFYITTGPMLSGCRILEYGGGPGHIYPLISAAPFASEIVFAEYAEQNRKVAEQWKSYTSETPEMTALLEHVVRMLENNTAKNAVQERAMKLRSLISQILPCDINQEVALRDCTLPFDIVSTHLCLTAATSSVEQYVLNLRKLARLLRPGGMIVMTEPIGGTFYLVGSQRLPDLYVSSTEVVRESLLQAGFTDVSIKTMKVRPTEVTDHVEYAFCTAVLDSV